MLFVTESGKCTAFDVSAQGALATFTGDVLADVEAVLADPGKMTGMILRTGAGGILRADAEADELFLNEVIPGNSYRETPTIS